MKWATPTQHMDLVLYSSGQSSTACSCPLFSHSAWFMEYHGEWGWGQLIPHKQMLERKPHSPKKELLELLKEAIERRKNYKQYFHLLDFKFCFGSTPATRASWFIA